MANRTINAYKKGTTEEVGSGLEDGAYFISATDSAGTEKGTVTAGVIEFADTTVNVRKEDETVIDTAEVVAESPTVNFDVPNNDLTVNNLAYKTIGATEDFDIPLIDQDDNPITPTIDGDNLVVNIPVVQPYKIAYHRQLPLLETIADPTIWFGVDEGSQFQNGLLLYEREGTAPILGINRYSLHQDTPNDFIHTNPTAAEGCFKIITGKTGGFLDEITGQYKDINGNVTTEALAFPDAYWINHWYGYGLNKTRIASFPPPIDQMTGLIASNYSAGGYTNNQEPSFNTWRPATRNEIFNLFNQDSTGDAWDYNYWNYNGSQMVSCSPSQIADRAWAPRTTSLVAWTITAASSILRIRNHFPKT